MTLGIPIRITYSHPEWPHTKLWQSSRIVTVIDKLLSSTKNSYAKKPVYKRKKKWFDKCSDVGVWSLWRQTRSIWRLWFAWILSFIIFSKSIADFEQFYNSYIGIMWYNEKSSGLNFFEGVIYNYSMHERRNWKCQKCTDISHSKIAFCFFQWIQTN